MTRIDRICACSVAAEVLWLVGHLVRDEERPDLFDEVVKVVQECLARRDAMKDAKRLDPSRK